jgi:3-hydroxypropanoate dehydrogenase
MANKLNQDALDVLFHKARSRNAWSDKPISLDVLEQIYEALSLGPTSMNCSPARFLFLVSKEAKERLAPHLMEGNRAKTLAAPCVAVIGYDSAFYEKMPHLFPVREGIREMFHGNQELAKATAFRNGTLQGAYLMMAARAHGLDCGPMSGFNNAGVDEEFFSGTTIKSNFLCSLGYAVDTPFPRLPRLSFDDASSVL